MEHPKFCVYVLYSLKDFQFYIGFSTNFERRMQEHANGETKSTAPRRPFIPLFCEYYYSKADATRRELYFKTSAGRRTLKLMLQESLNFIQATRAAPGSVS